ncbi:serine hydrolase domain-containing protein [Pseudomonas quasicaspiana]|uniref:serine hydrolase domain-containing protein n=1 Tax=Pseudomonas quasicaspiana TaxID=2829821 RepID=UPI000EFEA428|nr:serine hydrolase domain-containing protein [Pseudomonas quasicaspiana]MCD5976487.1 beta-lactamase family protein [Pseudomonas quasicaspiana]
MPFSLIINGSPAVTEPADALETVIPWWSFTKTVLAATALTLVRDGLVGLDDQVAEGPFTLRQLLRHQAGLADYSELPEYHAAVASGARPWPADEMLQRLDATRLRYTPGEGWRYSNVGYLFVTRLIERLTGLSLEEALVQRVLSPLGITRARLANTGENLQSACQGVAPGYDSGWVYHRLLIGPLAEAALLLERLLSGNLLPHGLLEDMQTALVLGGPLPGRPWLTPGYGLGLMLGGVAGGLTLSGHNGVGPGSVVAVYRCTQGRTTVACAVFHEGPDEALVEAELVQRITSAL